jgi:hypothetical protein
MAEEVQTSQSNQRMRKQRRIAAYAAAEGVRQQSKAAAFTTYGFVPANLAAYKTALVAADVANEARSTRRRRRPGSARRSSRSCQGVRRDDPLRRGGCVCADGLLELANGNVSCLPTVPNREGNPDNDHRLH